jgi:hypothetical protein
MQGSLSIERMCLLARVSRSGFYRFLKAHVPREEDTEVRSAIQQVVIQHRFRYGYRRVTAELMRRGMQVNHKRVARIMREDNLLAVQPKEFVTTTDSNDALEIYLNLSRRVRLNSVDQLWVADITYIRVQAEFVYLAVIRRVLFHPAHLISAYLGGKCPAIGQSCILAVMAYDEWEQEYHLTARGWVAESFYFRGTLAEKIPTPIDRVLTMVQVTVSVGRHQG